MPYIHAPKYSCHSPNPQTAMLLSKSLNHPWYTPNSENILVTILTPKYSCYHPDPPKHQCYNPNAQNDSSKNLAFGRNLSHGSRAYENMNNELIKRHRWSGRVDWLVEHLTGMLGFSKSESQHCINQVGAACL